MHRALAKAASTAPRAFPMYRPHPRKLTNSPLTPLNNRSSSLCFHILRLPTTISRSFDLPTNILCKHIKNSAHYFHDPAFSLPFRIAAPSSSRNSLTAIASILLERSRHHTSTHPVTSPEITTNTNINMSTQTKKNKGMKKHKKAQNEKAVAKRAVVAEKAKKSKMGSKVEMKTLKIPDVPRIVDEGASEMACAGEEAVSMVSAEVRKFITETGDPEVTVALRCEEMEGALAEHTVMNGPVDLAAENYPRVDSMLFDQHIVDPEPRDILQPTTSSAYAPATLQEEVDIAPSAETVDIQTHREALETALYDATESPMERLTRLANIKSASAEYRELEVDSEDSLLDDKIEEVAGTPKRAIDENGFNALNPYVHRAAGVPRARSISIDVLFAKASEDGASVVGHSDPKASYTLANVESHVAIADMPRARSVSIDELSFKASENGGSVMGHSDCKTSYTLANVKAQLATANLTRARSISVGELFSKASESGVSFIGHSDAQISYTLADIVSHLATIYGCILSPDKMEVEKWPSMPISQLFGAAALGEELVVELPAVAGNEYTRRARKLTFIEDDMTFSREDQISEAQPWLDPANINFPIAEVQPFVDPTIIGYKIKKTEGAIETESLDCGVWSWVNSPSRSSEPSVYDDRPYTPATFYTKSSSPVPLYHNTQQYEEAVAIILYYPEKPGTFGGPFMVPYDFAPAPLVPEYSGWPPSRDFAPDETYARELHPEQYWAQQYSPRQFSYQKIGHGGPCFGKDAHPM